MKFKLTRWFQTNLRTKVNEWQDAYHFISAWGQQGRTLGTRALPGHTGFLKPQSSQIHKPRISRENGSVLCPHTSLLAKQHLKLSNGNEHDLKNVQLVSYKRGTWPGMLKNLGLILLLELLSWQSQMEGVAHGLQGFCGLWWGRKSKKTTCDQRKQEIQHCYLRNCKNLTSP